MTCEEIENRILARQENQLSTDERAEVEKHLAECLGCQNVARQLQQLDAALAIKMKAPALSADFSQRLAKRIQAETTGLSNAQRAERKRQLQMEYEAKLKQLQWRSLRGTGLMEGLGYSLLAALAGWLAWESMTGLLNVLSVHGLGASSQNLLVGLAVGAVFLAIGLAAASPRMFRKLWSGI